MCIGTLKYQEPDIIHKCWKFTPNDAILFAKNNPKKFNTVDCLFMARALIIFLSSERALILRIVR